MNLTHLITAACSPASISYIHGEPLLFSDQLVDSNSCCQFQPAVSDLEFYRGGGRLQLCVTVIGLSSRHLQPHTCKYLLSKLYLSSCHSTDLLCNILISFHLKMFLCKLDLARTELTFSHVVELKCILRGQQYQILIQYSSDGLSRQLSFNDT